MDPRPIEAFEQRGELSRRQPHHAIVELRSAELAAFETLGQKAHARATPEQQLHAIRTPRAEHIGYAGERFELQLARDDGREPVHALAEVDWLRRDQYAGVLRQDYPVLPEAGDANDLSTLKTIASALVSTAPRTRTVTEPMLTSIVGSAAIAAPGVAIGSDGVSSTTTGANIGAASDRYPSFNASASERHLLCQPNSCCGSISHRRVISETFTPDASACATIAIF